MSDTPRTDARRGFHGWYTAVDAEFSEKLERELNATNDRIRLLIAERDTARQQSDQKVSLREEFRELLGTDDIEQGITVVCDLKQLAAVRLSYIKQLEEELMDAKNKRAVLVADVVLNEDRAERIKQLEKDSERLAWLIKTGLAWRGCYNDWWIEGTWLYASQSALETIDEAKDAK